MCCNVLNCIVMYKIVYKGITILNRISQKRFFNGINETFLSQFKTLCTTTKYMRNCICHSCRNGIPYIVYLGCDTEVLTQVETSREYS